jgi:hypothetical protein
MPFDSGIGGTGSGLSGVTLAGVDPISTAGPIWMQTPFLVVTANGVPLANVLSVNVVTGLDVTVASAQVELTENPLVPQNATIWIVAGTGSHNVQRFRGFVKRQRATLWPHVFTLICRGTLSLADDFRQAVNVSLPSFINQRLPIVGLGLYDLLPLPTPATDESYVLAVLNRVPGLEPFVDPANIGGTGHIFGTFSWKELTWPPNVSALAQVQKLDEVCLGYRVVEGPSGTIYRPQVFGYPTNIADAQFIEGIDIWDATGERSIEHLTNAEYVEGYIFGGMPGLVSAYLPQDNDFQSADSPFIDTFSSPLIDDPDFAAQVAEWRLGERNRETVNIQLVTFRDDLIIPGRTITVDSPHANVQEPVWVQHVELLVRAQPVLFQQTISGIGGGGVGGAPPVGDYSPPNIA